MTGPGEPSEEGVALEPACDVCLSRAWLIGRLGGHLERQRGRSHELLTLPDTVLLAAVGGRETRPLAEELLAFDPAGARGAAAQAGLETVCRCSAAYPAQLRELPAPPAVLHVAGGAERLRTLARGDLVAVVGSRRVSEHGRQVAVALGRGLAASGVGVLSGLAFGIDGSAHEGACSVGGPAVAVLPGGADRPYPAAHRRLRQSVIGCGVVLSELPPGTRPWRWSFMARNRILAALAGVTVVVEAGETSGALLTAASAQALGRIVAAVPGQVTLASARGSNALLASGARFVRGTEDVLDLLGLEHTEPVKDQRGDPTPAQQALLERIAAGDGALAGLAGVGQSPQELMALLAELELDGRVSRGAGGRYTMIP